MKSTDNFLITVQIFEMMAELLRHLDVLFLKHLETEYEKVFRK